MNKKGFTLIELLVVVSIIGVLTALVMVNFNSARARARDVQRKSDLDQVKKALRMYYNDYDGYPEASEGQIVACEGDETFAWGSQFACGDMVYMKTLPKDPDPDANYTYEEGATDQDFLLRAALENKSDSDLCESQVHCGTAENEEACDWDLGWYVVCADRSEERRVGKECRSRWSPY